LPADHDELVDLVCRMQKSRFDDQRCDLKHPNETDSIGSGGRGQRMFLQTEKKKTILLIYQFD